jgi:hypothetical protein
MDSNQNSEYESTVDNTDADVTWNPPDHNLNSDSDCNNQTRNQEVSVKLTYNLFKLYFNLVPSQVLILL